MRRQRVLRTWLVLLGLGWATLAGAVEPLRLPLGVWYDLKACLQDGSRGACSRAAATVDDPAWAAWLTGTGGDGLSGPDQLVYLHLTCADGDPAACSTLAQALSEGRRPDRLRAARLYMAACAEGGAAACTVLGLQPAADVDRALSGASTWSSSTASATPAPATADLRRLTRACDAAASPLRACVEAAGSVWQTLGSLDELDRARASLSTLCPRGGDGAACRLADDLSHPDRPIDDALLPTDQLLRMLCRQGEVGRACELRGQLITLGRAVPFGTWPARDAWGRACDLGADTACARQTLAARTPWAITSQAACERLRAGGTGHPAACTETVVMLSFGVGLRKDEVRAATLQPVACERGAARVCGWLAADAVESGDPSDAARFLDQGCIHGDLTACGLKARGLRQGILGLTKDARAGRRLADQACARSGSVACLEAGQSWQSDDEGRGDAAAAAQRLLLGCSVGSIPACTALGAQYVGGSGVPRDADHGMRLISFACHRGDVQACRFLGDGFGKGEGGIPTMVERGRWAYGRACDAGDLTSCRRLKSLGDGPSEPVPLATLPPLRPAAEGLSALATTGPTRPAPPDNPSPRPRPSPRPDRERLVTVGLGLGSARSWEDATQASSVRASTTFVRGLGGFGLDLDWVSDNRWKPKVARSTFRFDLGAHGVLSLPIPGAFGLLVGGGGALGVYRPGPGTTGDAAFSAGFKELIEFRFTLEELSIGLRVEQQQRWQDVDGLGLDHITGIYGIVGVALD